jgi:hypothetical protein
VAANMYYVHELFSPIQQLQLRSSTACSIEPGGECRQPRTLQCALEKTTASLQKSKKVQTALDLTGTCFLFVFITSRTGGAA